jgi:methylthioribose-1-phosphate isomerase
MKIETLRWFNNRLEMIDQRILPAAFEYLSYYTASSVAEGIRHMVVRGAPAIGVAAA